jgi:hypothetical protein
MKQVVLLLLLFFMGIILCDCNHANNSNHANHMNESTSFKHLHKKSLQDQPSIKYLTQDQLDDFSEKCYEAIIYGDTVGKMDEDTLAEAEYNPLGLSFFINDNGVVSGNIIAEEPSKSSAKLSYCAVRAFLWDNNHYKTAIFQSSAINSCLINDLDCQIWVDGVTNNDYIVAHYVQNGFHLNRLYGLLYYDRLRYHERNLNEANVDMINNHGLVFSPDMEHILATKDVEIISPKCQKYELYKWYSSIEIPYVKFHTNPSHVTTNTKETIHTKDTIQTQDEQECQKNNLSNIHALFDYNMKWNTLNTIERIIGEDKEYTPVAINDKGQYIYYQLHDDSKDHAVHCNNENKFYDSYIGNIHDRRSVRLSYGNASTEINLLSNNGIYKYGVIWNQGRSEKDCLVNSNIQQAIALASITPDFKIKSLKLPFKLNDVEINTKQVTDDGVLYFDVTKYIKTYNPDIENMDLISSTIGYLYDSDHNKFYKISILLNNLGLGNYNNQYEGIQLSSNGHYMLIVIKTHISNSKNTHHKVLAIVLNFSKGLSSFLQSHLGNEKDLS